MNIYILFVLRRYEHKIREFINAYDDMEAIVPSRIKLIKKRTDVIKEEQLLFPGYVFIKTSKENKDFRAFVQHYVYPIKGFIKVLSHTDKDVSALSDEEVRTITPFFRNDGLFESSVGFVKDDKVIVTSGPLMGLESQIKYIDRHKKMAILEIPLFNEVKEVKVSLEILSKQ